MRDTTPHFKRLLDLIYQAEEMKSSAYPDASRANAWQISATSLLGQLVGSTHVYSSSFRAATGGIDDAAVTSDVRKMVLGRGRAILEAVKQDVEAGIEFPTEGDGFPAERSQVEAVLVRVERLLDELIRLLRDPGRGKGG